ncbi:MAG: polyribonucleotide nucleotidyltransferase [Acidobacteria bacterium]|nr:polyribonucleotide nucleotidyltransferase [Acidobacteriota bacterium]
MIQKASTNLGGREFSMEIGRVARQADGAVIVRFGDTVVLVSACAALKPKEGASFFPLTCDYREYTYAAGKIPGGFFKREGRPTEKEILTSRLIDRPLRPLFPDGFRNESQVIALVLSADPDNNPDVLAITGASAALYLSPIPYHNPVAGVRVGLLDEQLVINPTFEQLKTSRLNLVVAGTKDAIVMVEAGAKEVAEEKMVEALQFGHEHIKELIGMQEAMFRQRSVVKREFTKQELDPALLAQVEQQASDMIRQALYTPGKILSYQMMDEVRDRIVESYPEDDTDKRLWVGMAFERTMERIFREDLLKEKKRPDGRQFKELRNITAEVGLLPRTHGSALFTRGETQALVTATLGTADDMQRIDDMLGEYSKKFMLHYNFPPFSVGEVGFLRGPGRREIGHGALAERAILGVLPEDEKFPYTLRVVSDILESNGSSSMATVCGAVLALMDAGVPIRAPVAGIAMGLIKEGDNTAVLTDIAGAEDHYGDMDFKVAGTAKGITALQMDIKVAGIDATLLSQALRQAKEARLIILEKMLETISHPRADISAHAPRIIQIQIPVAKIGAVIGPGGKVIRGIQEQTGAEINIEDNGTVNVASVGGEAAQAAIRMIQELTATAEVGKTYLGKVTKVVDFGAFVEILPGTEGLLHISEYAEHRIRDIHDECKVGDQILVKALSVDSQNKIKLSRKAVLRDQKQTEGKATQEA